MTERGAPSESPQPMPGSSVIPLTRFTSLDPARRSLDREAITLVIYILLAGICVSCSTVERQSGSTVALPKLAAEGVSFDDGIQKDEAIILSSVYFHRFVSGCGMPDDPQGDGKFWRVQLWGGYAGSDYGTLRLAKDGSEILLTAPRSGFKSGTRELLKRQNLI